MLRTASSCLDEATLAALATRDLDRDRSHTAEGYIAHRDQSVTAEAHIAQGEVCRGRLAAISEKRNRLPEKTDPASESTTPDHLASSDSALTIAALRARLSAEGELIGGRYRFDRWLG